eukprot:scaffold135745_cov30-Attheya_sp.AAC.1
MSIARALSSLPDDCWCDVLFLFCMSTNGWMTRHRRRHDHHERGGRRRAAAIRRWLSRALLVYRYGEIDSY